MNSWHVGVAAEAFAAAQFARYTYDVSVQYGANQPEYTWETLAKNIDKIVEKYDVGGTKENLGNISHRAVINALKQFKKFVQQ